MKSLWFGIIILAFGGYRLYLNDYLETAMYSSVGLGFVLTYLSGLITQAPFQKILKIASWVLIIAGILLFIAVLRRDAYGW